MTLVHTKMPAQSSCYVVLLSCRVIPETLVKQVQCDISGPGLKSATTKQVSKFTVCTHDADSPSQQNVSAELKSLVDGSVLQATVVRQTPSTYKLSYTPTTRGRHQLTVRVNNTEIGVFQVFVQHPPTQLSIPVRVIKVVAPSYIAVSDKGELFVSEDNKYTVRNAQGQRVLTIGSKGKPPFRNGLPFGIATDGEGSVYVASFDNKVQKFNKRGEVVKSIGNKGKNFGEFDSPWGVRYHNHQVYVCDRSNGRVQVFDSDLNFVRSFGGQEQLKDPVDIDFDIQGNIYVVDCNKKQVLVYGEDGQHLHHFDYRGRGTSLVGLCVSGDYLYVTEFWINGVSVFRTSGEFVHSFGRDVLWRSCGIAIDQDGFVFVCDTEHNCIQVF